MLDNEKLQKPVFSAAMTGEHLSVLDEAGFRRFLQEELIQRCKKNSSYSLRSFAGSLGVSHSSLSLFLNGKRSITKKLFQKLCVSMKLSPKEVGRFFIFEPIKNSRERQYKQLEDDVFEIIADWHHFAILELISVKNFQPNAQWVAAALGIHVAEVKLAIERLQRLQFLKVGNDGSWIVDSSQFTEISHPQMATAARMRLQKQLFSKALDAIEDVPIEQRSHSGITFAMDSRRIPEAKKIIKEFCKSLRDLMDGAMDGAMDSAMDGAESNDQVYQLSIGLFPLTKIKNKKGNIK